MLVYRTSVPIEQILQKNTIENNSRSDDKSTPSISPQGSVKDLAKFFEERMGSVLTSNADDLFGEDGRLRAEKLFSGKQSVISRMMTATQVIFFSNSTLKQIFPFHILEQF